MEYFTVTTTQTCQFPSPFPRSKDIDTNLPQVIYSPLAPVDYVGVVFAVAESNGTNQVSSHLMDLHMKN